MRVAVDEMRAECAQYPYKVEFLKWCWESLCIFVFCAIGTAVGIWLGKLFRGDDPTDLMYQIVPQAGAIGGFWCGAWLAYQVFNRNKPDD